MFAFQEVLDRNRHYFLDLTEFLHGFRRTGRLTNSYVSHPEAWTSVTLRGVNERVQTLLQITKLDQLFEVYPTVEGAQAA